ncbi:MAG: hypothetical protein WA790_16850 [Sulfitobacter sp.]
MLRAETITSIYDAAFSENHWHQALDGCAEVMMAKGAMLYEFPDLRQIDFALEATNTAFIEIADDLAAYNQMLADGHGSGFDQEGLNAIDQCKPCEVRGGRGISDQ